MKADLTSGLPTLNDSQYRAVEHALNKAFTIIQGPPGERENFCLVSYFVFTADLLLFFSFIGTGKTVVGVYIVYWFVELNSKHPRTSGSMKDEDKNKKEVVLYCGPSNKSVDVVAGVC